MAASPAAPPHVRQARRAADAPPLHAPPASPHPPASPRLPQAAARKLPLGLTRASLPAAEDGLTLFERKYWTSGEGLYRLASPGALEPVSGRVVRQYLEALGGRREVARAAAESCADGVAQTP